MINNFFWPMGLSLSVSFSTRKINKGSFSCLPTLQRVSFFSSESQLSLKFSLVFSRKSMRQTLWTETTVHIFSYTLKIKSNRWDQFNFLNRPALPPIEVHLTSSNLEFILLSDAPSLSETVFHLPRIRASVWFAPLASPITISYM
jgi:hypothetical protein